MIKHLVKDLAMARNYLRDELLWPIKYKEQQEDPKNHKRREFLLKQRDLGPIVEIRLSDGQVFTDHYAQFEWDDDWGLCYMPQGDQQWDVCHTINPAQIVSYSVKTPGEEQMHALWMKARAEGLEDDPVEEAEGTDTVDAGTFPNAPA